MVPNVAALSRLGGVVTITQDVPVANGRAISGRYDFQAQRTDEYTDPLGTLPIRGTFVAPVVTDSGPCIS